MNRDSTVCEVQDPSYSAVKRLSLWSFLVLCVVGPICVWMCMPNLRFLPSSIFGLTPATFLLIFLAALSCEYIDSALGMGYGTMLTPLLLLAGFDPLHVVPCILLSEFLTGLTAAAMHQRDGNVDLLRDPEAKSAACMLSLFSVVGAFAAVFIALHIPKDLLKGAVGGIILGAGLLTLVSVRRQLKYRRGHLVLVGALAAFSKGLSGGGYGPLVTSGQILAGLPPRKSVAITSLAESLTCLVGITAYLAMQGGFDYKLALPLVIGALLSVPVATLTVRRLPEQAMRAGVGLLTCVLGALTLCKLLW